MRPRTVASCFSVWMPASILTGCVAPQTLSPPPPSATTVTPPTNVEPVADPEADALAKQLHQYADQMTESLAQRRERMMSSDARIAFPANPVETMPSESAQADPPVLASMDQTQNVRIEAAKPPAAMPPAAESQAVQSQTVPPPVDPNKAVESQFTRPVRANPADVLAQFDLQLYRFLRKQPTATEAELSQLSPDDRRIVLAVIESLTDLRTNWRSQPDASIDIKARPLVELGDHFANRADLTIDTAAFCTVVRAFGSYDPIEPARFTAGESRWVVFYCEVDGFASRPDEANRWTTRLSMSLKLFTESGVEIWATPAQEVTDVARRPRRDFFLNQKIQIPATLAPGRYFVKATVEDLIADRVAEKTVTIEVTAR